MPPPNLAEAAGEEHNEFQRLRTPVNPERFRTVVSKLHGRFSLYIGTCPAPLLAPGLAVTPEIRRQCELYLPVAEITAAFEKLYHAALAYPPIISSTPFHAPLSWADCFVSMPPEFQRSANPAQLLEELIADDSLLTRFLCASFLPGRFYGGCLRYPGQQAFISRWLDGDRPAVLHCLDAACGTGEQTYALARLAAEAGVIPERIHIEGWTVEPLEVCAARRRRLPHDRKREQLWREATDDLVHRGYGSRITFDCRDILETQMVNDRRFDLIICNGLLGGPIIHDADRLERCVAALSNLLAERGVLLTANRFHGGWQQKCPQEQLRALGEKYGFVAHTAGEGLAFLKPDKQAAPG